MPTATMTSKGQITVPLEVRERLGLGPGTKVDFAPDGDCYRMSVRKASARELAGLLARPDRPVTLAEMERGIAVGASGVGL